MIEYQTMKVEKCDLLFSVWKRFPVFADRTEDGINRARSGFSLKIVQQGHL